MLTLRELIESKLEHASSNITKLAQSESPESEEKKEEAKEEKKEEKKEEEEKTSSISTNSLLKLAAQCDYVSKHITKIAAVADAVGPGKGPNALPVEGSDRQGGLPVGGKATQTTPEGTTEEPAAATVTTPQTVVQTNETDPPAEGQSLVVKTSQMERVYKLLKNAQETSEAGPGLGAGTIELNTPEAPDPPIPPEGKLVQTLEGAMDYTKRDAKEKPKEDLKAYLQEPAQKKSTDPVLQQQFSRAEEAGVKTSTIKVAAARAFLQKIAEQGCTCGETDECYHCKLAQAMEETAEEEEDKGKEEKKEEKKEKEKEKEPESSKEAIQY
jgi:hypothetical protein